MQYERELLKVAKTEGPRIDCQDERLVGFPSVVRIVPAECAVMIPRGHKYWC